MSLLNKLAVNGKRTIIATLHQPRSTIFDMIDQLMILDAGRTGKNTLKAFNFLILFFIFIFYFLFYFSLFWSSKKSSKLF
jgi:hypothetical protein